MRAIHDNEILGASGFHGDPTVGDPLEVDSLEIVHYGALDRMVALTTWKY